MVVAAVRSGSQLSLGMKDDHDARKKFRRSFGRVLHDFHLDPCFMVLNC